MVKLAGFVLYKMPAEHIHKKNDNTDATSRHKASLFFYGEEGDPFLAPRGVYSANEKLIVADTAQNRVLIWNKIPLTSYLKPDIVLGQFNSTEPKRNAGNTTNASSLSYPSGIWSDGNILIVADAWNHRVLIWNKFPMEDNQPADTVIGQPGMQNNLPNVQGIAKQPTARTLYWPYGIGCNGKHLWIADTGNRRILFYNTIPQTNYKPADKVIGQQDFKERDYNSEHAIWPYSVKTSESGMFAIADVQYYRILIWKQWKDAFSKKADIIIGQPDMESCGQNQYQSKPAANTLGWCYDMAFSNNSFYVADTGNSRILHFENIPAETNTEADDLYGNGDFESPGEHLHVGKPGSEYLYWPFSVTIANNRLIVADTGNHRIIIYNI